MSSEDDMVSHYGGDSHEDDDRSSEESEEEDDEDHKATEKLARVPGQTFCPDHKPGQMVEVCLTCRTALALVRPNMAKQLVIPDKTSSAVHRYAMRSDKKKPSLFLSGNMVDLAENVFTSGLFKSKTHWQDLVKKFLTLPVTQHERLVRDLELEDLFKSHQSDRRFAHVFKYRRELGDALKMLRISQRVIFDNVYSVDMLIPKIREHTEKAGVVFPDNQPARDNDKVPNQLPCQTAYRWKALLMYFLYHSLVT